MAGGYATIAVRCGLGMTGVQWHARIEKVGTSFLCVAGMKITNCYTQRPITSAPIPAKSLIVSSLRFQKHLCFRNFHFQKIANSSIQSMPENAKSACAARASCMS